MMTLSQGLKLQKGECICLVGGGGKTSTLMMLAKENPFKGGIFSTTTRMLSFRPEEIRLFSKVIFEENYSIPCYRQHGVQFIAEHDDGTKIKGLPPQTFDCDAGKSWPLTVIEADGAACRGLKMPSPYEPVIPQSCTHVIGLLAIDSIGKKAGPETIHRFPIASNKLGIQLNDTISGRMLFDIITHPEGLFQYTKPESRRTIILNKMDALPSTEFNELSVLVNLIKEWAQLNPTVAPSQLLLCELQNETSPIWEKINL